MRRACVQRNFSEIFRLVNRRTGASYADIAGAVGKMSSARVGDVIRGVRNIRGESVIGRVADGLGIPGPMLGLAARKWEKSRPDDTAHNNDTLSPSASNALRKTLTAADESRQLMDRALASRTVTPEHMETLEHNVARYARSSVVAAPLDMLKTLLSEFDEIRRFMTEAQSPGIQGRLYRVASQIAALTADELMVLGDARQAWAWHSTARNAADATGQRPTMMQVRAVGTLIPLYYGDSTEAAMMAREVRDIAENSADRPSAATALAATLESLALAQNGDSSGSTTALNQAESAFDGLDTEQRAESVFGFSERRWHFYRARIISLHDDPEKAWEAQEHALSLYPDQVIGDPSIIRIERAKDLVRRGDVQNGCEHAGNALLRMPPEHRTEIFIGQVDSVLRSISPAQRSMPAVRDLRDLMTELHQYNAITASPWPDAIQARPPSKRVHR